MPIKFDPKKSKICTYNKKDYYCIEYKLVNNELVKLYFEKFNDEKITVKSSNKTRIILADFLIRVMDDFYYCVENKERLKIKINSESHMYYIFHVYQNNLARKGKTKDASLRIYFNFKGNK